MVTHSAALFPCPQSPLSEWLPPGCRPLSVEGRSVLAVCLSEAVPSDHDPERLTFNLHLKAPTTGRPDEGPGSESKTWIRQLTHPELQWTQIACLPLNPKGIVTAHFSAEGWFVQALEDSRVLLTLSGQPGRSLGLPTVSSPHPLPIDLPPKGRLPLLRRNLRLLNRGSLTLTINSQLQGDATLDLLRRLQLDHATPLFAIQHADRAPK